MSQYMVSGMRAGWKRVGWAWGQALTVLAAVAVIVAMVLVAESARQDEKHHQTVQVLVERVRASALELENFVWRGLAESLDRHERVIHAGPFVTQALRRWNDLAALVAALRAADDSPATQALLNDAGRLYGAGMSLVSSANGFSNVHQGMTSTQALFAPLIEALDRDASTAAAAQRRVADQARNRGGLRSSARSPPDCSCSCCSDSGSTGCGAEACSTESDGSWSSARSAGSAHWSSIRATSSW